MKRFLCGLLAFLFLFSLISIALASDPKVPRGIFSLTPNSKPIDPQILTNPLVTGVTVRQNWSNIEPKEGQYDWSYLDREVARVAAADKVVFLRVTSGGTNTPKWVLAKGAKTFTFVDKNQYHGAYGKAVVTPLFWDPVFLGQKKKFIKEIGRHFTDNPNIVLVATTCANGGGGGDWFVPHTPADVSSWRAAGYTSQKLIQACKEVIQVTMEAFPNQIISMAVGKNGPGLDPAPLYVADKVISWAQSKYPGRFVAQINGLSADTPEPDKKRYLGEYKLLYDHRPYVAGQMKYYVTDEPTCRMSGKSAPCDPEVVLKQAVAIGTKYGMLYEEIYEQDILNSRLSEVIRYAANILKSSGSKLR